MQDEHEPELSWRDVLSFLQSEITSGETQGYPSSLVRLIWLLLESAKLIYSLVEHLQDPENRYHKVCLECGKEFYHTNQWVKTCTIKCHKKWLDNPHGYLSDHGNVRSTVLLMQQVEHQEKVRP